MNIKRYNIFLFFYLTLFLVSVGENNKKILVLHSYHQGFYWTDSITEGIKSVFSKDANIELYYEYLDTKRNSSNIYLEKLAELYKIKNPKTKFDGIIAVDNFALSFLIKYRKDLYPDVPIVFCGINNFHKKLLGNEKNITGVIERLDYKNTLDLMLRLHPKTKKIVIINDKTLTGKQIKKEILKVLPSYFDRVKFEFYEEFSVNEVREKLKNLDSETLVYLLLINKSRDNEFISYQKIGEILEGCKNPVYSSWGFYLNKGIVGGKLTQGFYQGEKAAELLKKIISGFNINRIKIDNKSHSKYIFDQKFLSKFDIKEKKLPSGSEIVDKKENVWHQHFQIMLFGILIFLLIIVLLILKLYLNNKKKAEITKLNMILEEKVTQRTFELEQANNKIKSQQQKLIKEAYKEGFTRVKSGIVHNIGNIVNPLYIAIQEEINYRETDERNEIKFFEEVLLKELNESFQKTKKLSRILDVMPNILTAMKEKKDEELNRLKYCEKEIVHLKSVLKLQQNYAGTLGTENYFDVNKILEEVVEKRKGDNGLNFELILKPLEKILCDRLQILQVFENIIKNQYENLVESEKLYKLIRVMTMNDKNYIKIVIEANGEAYSEEFVKNIFNLSFITKEKNRKNFELYGCYQIIKKYGGDINLESLPERGNVYTITIPK